jgi:hypothetical protein
VGEGNRNVVRGVGEEVGSETFDLDFPYMLASSPCSVAEGYSLGKHLLDLGALVKEVPDLG